MCNMVALVLNVFENKLQMELGWKMNYVVDVSNLLVVFNSSFNFVIYYKFSAPFRMTLRQYLSTGPANSASPSKCTVKTSMDGKSAVASYANGERSNSLCRILGTASTTEVLI